MRPMYGFMIMVWENVLTTLSLKGLYYVSHLQKRWNFEQQETKNPVDANFELSHIAQAHTSSIPFSVSSPLYSLSDVKLTISDNESSPQRRWSETSNEQLLCEGTEQGIGGIRRPWGFKFRKPSFTVRKAMDSTPGDGVIIEVCAPELQERLVDVTATVGGAATLQCTLRRGIRHTSALWRKTSPEARILRHAGRHAISFSKEGVAQLIINNCNSSDVGTYTCSLSNDLGSIKTSCELRLDTTCNADLPKSEPNVTNLPGVIPENTCLWEQQQFLRRYEELEEIGRGRTCVVRVARDRGTGQRVALKQVLLKHSGSENAQREYRLLAATQHSVLPRALAIFRNAPIPQTDTIVMELIRGPHLFTYVTQKEEYSEATVAAHSKQLVSALCWLHQNKIAHLDIKPENVMVDIPPSGGPAQVKLIDLGCAAASNCSNVVLPPAPAHLEFAAPESVLGRPRGTFTDSWGLGVLLYVFLSGVSPFLDDSLEETTANIVKCDYCFPVQHFEGIGEAAKNLIRSLLTGRPEHRPSMHHTLQEPWLTDAPSLPIRSTSALQRFQQRRLPPSPPP